MRKYLVLAVALTLPACAMTESAPINRMNLLGCETDSGAYFLSKTLLEVEVQRVDFVRPDGKTVVKSTTRVKHVQPKVHADRQQGYCLDYLSSPTSDEKIYIKKSPNQLLSLVSTQSIDQSAFILKNFINAFFTALSTGGDFRAENLQERVETAFKAEYDPLDVEQSALINASLSKLGICLLLENRTFDPNVETIDQYCNNPGGHGRLKRQPSHRSERVPVAEGARGILYRPRVPFNYYLFVKNRGTGKWRLRQTETIALENDSPVISVGVDRTFFANRRGALVFNEGVLKNVCIYKSSELLEFSTIPLTVANNIAALPTNVLQFKIDNSNNFRELASVEDQLIAAQREHLNVLQQGDDAAAAGKPNVKEPPQVSYTAPVVAGGNVRKVATGAFPEKWDAICPGSEIPEGPISSLDETTESPVISSNTTP